MKTLLRVFLFALTAGIGIGWFLAEQQRRREEQAARDAYANDPELVAIRKQRRLYNQVDDVIPGALDWEEEDETT